MTSRGWILVLTCLGACAAPPSAEGEAVHPHWFDPDPDPDPLSPCPGAPAVDSLDAEIPVALLRDRSLSDADLGEVTASMARLWHPYGLRFAPRGERRVVDVSGLVGPGEDLSPLAELVEGQGRPAQLGFALVLLPRLWDAQTRFGTEARGLALSPHGLAGAPEALRVAIGPAPFTAMAFVSWEAWAERDPQRWSRDVAAHEVGHLLGLVHRDAPGNLMGDGARCIPWLDADQIAEVRHGAQRALGSLAPSTAKSPTAASSAR